ncbi:MAG: DNA polymerase sliding clamp [Archaeoglobus sp.]|uniref:DNA polymerase sliding clamp n=1 Tax=Archaeoglobus sp. TaxID=1872626 RepID=UPI001D699DA2|nr:DNA polymerase sliding clamp [Archaeoglobus sp.]MBO8179855.1 DNA polymerase sliding clamp [Archaeoglobus sp.]
MQVLGFKGRLRAGILADVVKAASVIAWEVRAHFDEGLHIRAVNPENVAMVIIDVRGSAFESFNGKLTAGLDLDRLKNTIRAFSSRDIIDLEIGDRITLSNGRISYTLPLLKPESIRREPKVPNLELPAVVEIALEDFKKVVGLAEKISDAVVLQTDGEAFVMEAQGDMDSIRATFPSDKLVDYNGGEARSMFAVEYLKEFCKAAKPKDVLTIHLGNDYPARFVLDGDDVRVEYILAPRIETEG